MQRGLWLTNLSNLAPAKLQSGKPNLVGAVGFIIHRARLRGELTRQG